MTNLSIELVKSRLIEADEVKKAAVAKMKKADSGTQEIKDPTAGLARSERHDAITQIVQDGSFTADVAPAGGSDDLVPQADFADTYTQKMPHGQTAGMGKGENEKSPKGVGTTGMTPNQTTNLRQISGEIKHTEDDGDQKVFTIPQADFADEYTKKMDHGRAGGTTDEDGGDAAPAKRGYGKMDGGPTRAGGKKGAKLGGDAVGAGDKDSQKVSQVDGPGKEDSPGDSPPKATWKKDAKGTNIREDVESGVAVTLNGKRKATFEVVSHGVLNKMQESYAAHGYKVEFVRTDAAWKKDTKFLRALRESINARYNHAPNIAKAARKMAMQRFGQLCRESYNQLYEDRHDFVQTMGAAFKRIEQIAEDKYLDGLEPFECLARIVNKDGDVEDIAMFTQATDKDMASRQVRNKVYETVGFGVEMKHIFVDGEKFNPDTIKEFAPAIAALGRTAAQAGAAQAGQNIANKLTGDEPKEGRGKKKSRR